MSDKKECTVSDEAMERIMALEAWDQIILTAWRDIEPDFGSMEKVDVAAYSIPEEQWKQICDRIVSLPDTSIGRVNHGLDWMNVGPSAR